MSAVERVDGSAMLRVVAPRLAALAERQGGRSQSVDAQLLPRLERGASPLPRLSAAAGLTDRTRPDGGTLADRGDRGTTDDGASEREVRELRERVGALEAQTDDDGDDDPGEVF